MQQHVARMQLKVIGCRACAMLSRLRSAPHRARRAPAPPGDAGGCSARAAPGGLPTCTTGTTPPRCPRCLLTLRASQAAATAPPTGQHTVEDALRDEALAHFFRCAAGAFMQCIRCVCVCVCSGPPGWLLPCAPARSRAPQPTHAPDAQSDGARTAPASSCCVPTLSAHHHVRRRSRRPEQQPRTTPTSGGVNNIVQYVDTADGHRFVLRIYNNGNKTEKVRAVVVAHTVVCAHTQQCVHTHSSVCTHTQW
jgi:hypothetical protein